MNKSAFLKLIQQASNITDQQQSELEQVAATFPYCQTAHMLLAKSAYDRGSMLSTQRLRRASSYATDRQLLKRIIYSVPVLETVPAEATDTEETNEAMLANEQEHVLEPEMFAEEISAITEDVAAPEDAVSEETLEEVYSPVTSQPEPYPVESAETTEEEADPEAEIDSELAMLFTFSSISSSSTDLLRERDLEEADTDVYESEIEDSHYAETAEVLNGLEQEDSEVNSAYTEEQDSETASDLAEIPEQETEEQLAIPVLETALILADSEAAFFAEEDEPAPVKPEDAEINYSFDEIDRLYAEDALGYSMGSSRMGEVLQLKDDYTRPRPQSFHPELILEYSKTHELEKAIQPTAHVLSKQLDIIDQFLKLNPRLKTMANLKLKPEPQEDLSLKSSKIKKGMASESLAGIFLKQGKPKKALKIYEQLILKYPEKKSYFAEQIEKLQNIT